MDDVSLKASISAIEQQYSRSCEKLQDIVSTINTANRQQYYSHLPQLGYELIKQAGELESYCVQLRMLKSIQQLKEDV